MRTGPFSDPVIVTLINRYFIPVHLDNTDGSALRYGMEPGHENAYIILETPEVEGGPQVDSLILGKLSQVLEPANTRLEILSFLKKWPQFHQPWPELKALADATDDASKLRRAELLLEQGEADAALDLVGSLSDTRASLVRVRALRSRQQWSDATSAASKLGKTPEEELERIRLAFDRKQDGQAARMLDRFLASNPDSPLAPEAYFMRGWLYHRAKQQERAIELWQRSLARHPPATALYSQKAHLTMIRLNWELPEGVDQEK